jgi:hypothetical protein
MSFRKAHLHRFYSSWFLGPALVVTVDEVQYQLHGPQTAPEAIGHLPQTAQHIFHQIRTLGTCFGTDIGTLAIKFIS